MTAASKPTATAAAAVKTFPSVAQGAKPGLKDVADLIKDGTVKNVIIMVRRWGLIGAGNLHLLTAGASYRLVLESARVPECQSRAAAVDMRWQDRFANLWPVFSPDFRSPETGLYANLEKYNLP